MWFSNRKVNNTFTDLTLFPSSPVWEQRLDPLDQLCDACSRFWPGCPTKKRTTLLNLKSKLCWAYLISARAACLQRHLVIEVVERGSVFRKVAEVTFGKIAHPQFIPGKKIQTGKVANERHWSHWQMLYRWLCYVVGTLLRYGGGTEWGFNPKKKKNILRKLRCSVIFFLNFSWHVLRVLSRMFDTKNKPDYSLGKSKTPDNYTQWRTTGDLW